MAVPFSDAAMGGGETKERPDSGGLAPGSFAQALCGWLRTRPPLSPRRLSAHVRRSAAHGPGRHLVRLAAVVTYCVVDDLLPG